MMKYLPEGIATTSLVSYSGVQQAKVDVDVFEVSFRVADGVTISVGSMLQLVLFCVTVGMVVWRFHINKTRKRDDRKEDKDK